jgi:hypothetical protein
MKADAGLMTLIVAGGAFGVGYALAKISQSQSGIPAGAVASGTSGLSAVVRFQPARSLSGWGTPGFGRGRHGTGAAIYWRKVA